MAGDLGTGAGQVHAAAEAVLAFWLSEVPPEKRFARDDALDAEIAVRFGPLCAQVVTTRAAGWRGGIRPLLAAVILIDQFSRNLFRGSAEAFAGDGLARGLTDEAVARGWDADLTPTGRQFLYMPLMHSERMADQARAVALYAADGGEQFEFAKAHARQIARFARFPQRNAALGRANTAEEEAFLAEPGSSF